MIRSSECHIFEQMYAAQAEGGKFDFQNKLTHNQKKHYSQPIKKARKIKDKREQPHGRGHPKMKSGLSSFWQSMARHTDGVHEHGPLGAVQVRQRFSGQAGQPLLAWGHCKQTNRVIAKEGGRFA